jgi:hypothetical protein
LYDDDDDDDDDDDGSFETKVDVLLLSFSDSNTDRDDWNNITPDDGRFPGR